MAEAQVGAGESSVAGLNELVVGPVAGLDFLCQRHGTLFGFNRREKHFLLHAGDVEWEQPAVLDDLSCDFIFARSKFGEGDLRTSADLVDQRKVGGGKQSEVLAILLVDALDIFGDDHANAGTHFGVGRLLAAGTFAAALAADGGYESAFLDVRAADGKHVAAFQAKIGDLAQSFVEVEAVVGGSDFVGGNVIAQLGIVGWILGVPGQIFAGKLAFNELGVLGQEKNAAGEADSVGAFVDLAG